jgi:hypothetical protein
MERRVSWFLPFLAALFWTPVRAQVVFEARPATVRPGGDLTLVWNVPGVQSVTIPGYGIQPSSGQLQIAGITDPLFLLIAESPSTLIVRNVEVRVLGGRGDEEDFVTTLQLFRYPRDLNINNSFGLALDLFKKQLSSLGFISRTLVLGEDRVQFETNHAQLAALQKDLPKQFAARRISYLIEVVTIKTAAQVKGTIRSYIEYRRLREYTWYPVRDDDLYQKQTNFLVQTLGIQ